MASFKLDKTFASLPGTVRGQPVVLNGDPKGKNFLYCNGKQVFIRDIKDTSICDIYSEHSKETSVAKYSPSGFYIASGDKEGKVRIWDTVNPEHILKYEKLAMGGVIKDLDWSADNSKICAVGDGRQTFGCVFFYDSGSSCGDIMGHSKAINSCGLKQTRPFRLVTAGEDYVSVFFEGPPFKFKCAKHDHTNFINSTRYSPTGEIYITAGADGRMLIYDGKTSDFIEELGAPKAHKGGIYAICFNEDGKRLLSVSADKTAKIWDIEHKQLETEFVLGNEIRDQQVGCLWQKEDLITLSVSGYLNYLDVENPNQPKKIVKGHNKPISALTALSDGSRLISASSDGRVLSWSCSTGDCEEFKGKGHNSQVNGIVIDGDFVVTVGIDDTILYSDLSSLEFGQSFKLDSQPQNVDSKNGVAVIACANEVVIMENPGRKVYTLDKFEAKSVSIHPNGTEVALGGKSAITIYGLEKDGLKEIQTKISTPAEVTNVEYSPDGCLLAASFGKKVAMYERETWKDQIGCWGEQHTAKVMNLKWAPNSSRFITCSVDSQIILWPNGKYNGQKPCVKAHPLSIVTQVEWLDDNRVVSAGQDSNIKLWSVMQ